MIKKIISIIIILLVVLIGIKSLNSLTQDVFYESYENNCKTVYHEIGERNIILRIDDIQAYFLRDIQIKIIEDAKKRNKPLSLSVIPKGLSNDRDMFKFLQENRCDLEIGLHGYDNSDFEFAGLSYNKAREKILKGLNILNKIEPKIITFIPPNNEYSEGSRKAIFNSGLKIISADFYNSKYGYTQSPYNWNKNEFVGHEEVLNSCAKTLDENKTCVIMIHPQDYTINGRLSEKKYKNYINLLEGIDELNARVVTFRDMEHGNVEMLN